MINSLVPVFSIIKVPPTLLELMKLTKLYVSFSMGADRGRIWSMKYVKYNTKYCIQAAFYSYRFLQHPRKLTP